MANTLIDKIINYLQYTLRPFFRFSPLTSALQAKFRGHNHKDETGHELQDD